MKKLLILGVCLPLFSLARAQGGSDSALIEFRVARSVALKAEPRFDSRTIRILEVGSLMRGYPLQDGEWWQATYDLISGYVRDSAIDTTGRLGRTVVETRRRLAAEERTANRTTLRDSLRTLVSERRLRKQIEEAERAAHDEAVQQLVRQELLVSLLTARYLSERSLSELEREMMQLEEDEWARHCESHESEDCPALPGPGWGYALALENLYGSPIDSLWFELVSFDPVGNDLGSLIFRGIGPVDGGVPGGEWVFDTTDLPRGTACSELVELEIEWADGLVYRYSGESLRVARLRLPARGWPMLEAGPVGARFAERSRQAFGLNDVVLEGDCLSR